MWARVWRCNDVSYVLHASHEYVVEWLGKLLSWLWLQDFDWRQENVGQWCIPQYFTAVGKGVGVRVTTVWERGQQNDTDWWWHPETFGCIYRACFRNFEKYGKLEAALAENMWKAKLYCQHVALQPALSHGRGEVKMMIVVVETRDQEWSWQVQMSVLVQSKKAASKSYNLNVSLTSCRSKLHNAQCLL